MRDYLERRCPLKKEQSPHTTWIPVRCRLGTGVPLQQPRADGICAQGHAVCGSERRGLWQDHPGMVADSVARTTIQHLPKEQAEGFYQPVQSPCSSVMGVSQCGLHEGPGYLETKIRSTNALGENPSGTKEEGEEGDKPKRAPWRPKKKKGKEDQPSGASTS